MDQINITQVTPALTSLFNLNAPTGIRAFAVLAGGNNGRIFTDNPARPTWGMVWEADDGVLYRGGKYDGEILSEVVNLLVQEGIVALGFREGDSDVEFFPPNPHAGAECIEFDRPRGGSDLSAYAGALPNGYSVQRMDRTLLERGHKRDENLNRYGGVENFLEKGIAVCVLHGDEIVSEAYADMDIMGIREIGISTQKEYRKQGLATVACARLIELCEESGSRVYWDCAKFNGGSVALARKLGFQNPRPYKLLAWFKPED